jgi:hypothetical protein
MRRLLAAVLLCAPAAAGALDAAPSGGQPYWFKFYSTAPYAEIWTGELVVKDADRALPKVVEAVEKSGGKLSQPLSTFAGSAKDHQQQLTFSIPGKKTKALLKAMRKLGTLAEPAVRPMGAPIPLDEVRAKIDKMMKERTEHAAELAKVPAASAAEEEILEHLLMVEEVAQRTDTEVRFNLLVRQK